MDTRYLLAIALAAATVVAACGDASTDTLGNGKRTSVKSNGATAGEDDEDDGANDGSSDGSSDATPTGPVATNSPEGLAFFKESVHPFLVSTCGTCHTAAGPGPEWMTTSNPDKTYTQLFKAGYVLENSRIVVKGTHDGASNNALDATQKATFNQWVAMELSAGGSEAPPNILEKLGSCFDRAKFDAMQMGQWRTTRRTGNNNINDVTPWNENANNCTGCENAPCTTCHSADPATNFNNAVGNTLLPDETTFENTKLTTPAYITKFFAVSADGTAIASDGIKKKGLATQKDKAYTHPMFSLTDKQQAALDAFVQDAITKFAAGTCGQ